jgi:hypothetical protein
MPLVTVDRTGACNGFHFTENEPVDLPEEVIGALGSHATRMGAYRQETVTEAPIYVKEAKPKKDKMVRRAKITK